MKNRIPFRKSSKRKLDSSLKHRSKYLKKPRNLAVTLNQVVKIIIAYEGTAGLLSANTTRWEIAKHLGGKAQIETCAWNFSLLQADRLMEQAAWQAAEAHLVLVAPKASSELPEHIKNWIARWTFITRNTVQNLNHTAVTGMYETAAFAPKRQVVLKRSLVKAV